MPSRIPTPPETARISAEPEERKPEEQPEQPFIAKGTRDVTPHLPRMGSQAEPEITERIALVAHDLKTPLSIITLETQLLGERLSSVQSAPIQRGLDRIAKNAAYIDRLIADLLDLSAVDAGQLVLRCERVDLSRLLRETVDRAVSTVERGRVQLELRAGCYVHADRNRLERVVANLIGNALKYSTKPVTVLLEPAETRARVTVIDFGRGLTPDQAKTVFERYQRAGNTRGCEGYGLGLYISRKIIDAHAGQIGVVSTPGAGSHFFFELDMID